LGKYAPKALLERRFAGQRRSARDQERCVFGHQGQDRSYITFRGAFVPHGDDVFDLLLIGLHRCLSEIEIIRFAGG
jgi:hypothetical protein